MYTSLNWLVCGVLPVNEGVAFMRDMGEIQEVANVIMSQRLGMICGYRATIFRKCNFVLTGPTPAL